MRDLFEEDAVEPRGCGVEIEHGVDDRAHNAFERRWLGTERVGQCGELRLGVVEVATDERRDQCLLGGEVFVQGWVGEPLWEGGHLFGAILGLVGIGVTFVAQARMGRSWRIGVDASERTGLVTTGAFALVRNPIFSAMLLVSFGLALAVPTPLTVALPLLLLFALEVQVRFVEEPYLVRTHGAPYLEWASRTGRFVPGIGRLRLPSP
nr:MAG: hypothetical protein DIU78_26530 [Pseudomonadota bacterium]